MEQPMEIYAIELTFKMVAEEFFEANVTNSLSLLL